MNRPELNETLTALVGAVPLDATMTVLEVDLDVPLELGVVRRGNRLVVQAGPGHTRFASGFLPPVHHAHLRIVAEPPDGPEAATTTSEPDGWPTPASGGWPS